MAVPNPSSIFHPSNAKRRGAISAPSMGPQQNPMVTHQRAVISAHGTKHRRANHVMFDGIGSMTNNNAQGPSQQAPANPSAIPPPPPQPRRFIMSPLNHTQNLFKNAYGMAVSAMREKTNVAQPVFMDKKQQQRFNTRLHKEKNLQQQIINQNYQKNQFVQNQNYVDAQNNYKALQQLQKSSVGNPRFDMHDIDKNAELYIQGHGLPGHNFISTDKVIMPIADAQQRWNEVNPQGKQQNGRQAFYGQQNNSGQVYFTENVNAKRTAKILNNMKVSDKVQLRFNSCFSAAEKYPQVYDHPSTIRYQVQKGSLGQGLAGNPSNSFAGAVLKELNANRKDENHLYKGKGVVFPTYQQPQLAAQPGSPDNNFMSVGVPYQSNPYQQEPQFQAVRRSVAYVNVPSK